MRSGWRNSCSFFFSILWITSNNIITYIVYIKKINQCFGRKVIMRIPLSKVAFKKSFCIIIFGASWLFVYDQTCYLCLVVILKLGRANVSQNLELHPVSQLFLIITDVTGCYFWVAHAPARIAIFLLWIRTDAQRHWCRSWERQRFL